MSREKKYTVLIAEDEPLIRDNLSKKIEETDPLFTVTATAHNGNAAYTMIEKEIFDVLVTDIKMPVMDGLELIEKVYFSYPFMKIIIISGYDDFSYAQKALRFGVKEYILKPVNREELGKVFHRLRVQFEKETENLKERYIQYPENTAREELATDIAEYLRVNYTKQFSLSDIAERFYVNPAYVTKIFKRETGTVPSKYLQNLRINEAKRLLLDFPELEIQEISGIVGYSDQAYFSRIFKKTTGISPLEYREKPV